MKIQDIPTYFGHSQKMLAEMMGKDLSLLNKYFTGKKGIESKVKRDLANACDLQLEEVFFPDCFDHPEGEDHKNAAYWLNLALEGLREAKNKGAETNDIEKIILAYGETLLSELPEPE